MLGRVFPSVATEALHLTATYANPLKLVTVTLTASPKNKNRARAECRYLVDVALNYGPEPWRGGVRLVESNGAAVAWVWSQVGAFLARSLSGARVGVTIVIADAAGVPARWTADRSEAARAKVMRLDADAINADATAKIATLQTWVESERKADLTETSRALIAAAVTLAQIQAVERGEAFGDGEPLTPPPSPPAPAPEPSPPPPAPTPAGPPPPPAPGTVSVVIQPPLVDDQFVAYVPLDVVRADGSRQPFFLPLPVRYIGGEGAEPYSFDRAFSGGVSLSNRLYSLGESLGVTGGVPKAMLVNAGAIYTTYRQNMYGDTNAYSGDSGIEPVGPLMVDAADTAGAIVFVPPQTDDLAGVAAAVVGALAGEVSRTLVPVLPGHFTGSPVEVVGEYLASAAGGATLEWSNNWPAIWP